MPASNGSNGCILNISQSNQIKSYHHIYNLNNKRVTQGSCDVVAPHSVATPLPNIWTVFGCSTPNRWQAWSGRYSNNLTNLTMVFIIRIFWRTYTAHHQRLVLLHTSKKDANFSFCRTRIWEGAQAGWTPMHSKVTRLLSNGESAAVRPSSYSLRILWHVWPGSIYLKWIHTTILYFIGESLVNSCFPKETEKKLKELHEELKRIVSLRSSWKKPCPVSLPVHCNRSKDSPLIPCMLWPWKPLMQFTDMMIDTLDYYTSRSDTLPTTHSCISLSLTKQNKTPSQEKTPKYWSSQWISLGIAGSRRTRCEVCRIRAAGQPDQDRSTSHRIILTLN